MSNKLHRRKFLTRVSLALSSAVAAPFIGALRAADPQSKEEELPMNPIKSTRPLGFTWETQDPFLFCVHHEDAFPKGNAMMGPTTPLTGRHLGDDFIIKDGFRMYHGKVVPGFPGHPHRGFETITVVRKGLVDHADSLGAAGRYGNGDVQWMTAGKGVQHSEMFPLLSETEENPMELFQIWINLPAKDKMVEPHFTMLWRDAIPHYKHTDSNGKSTNVEVIAGVLGDKVAASPPPNSWAANPANEVAVWNIKMEPGATWTLPAASKGINRSIYFYEGKELQVGDQKLTNYSAAEMIGDIDVELIAGNEEVSILLLQGRPIGEIVMQYGPFVMNTKQEIQQAFEDYHATQFGGWPWPKFDQVHDRSNLRFAIHADGREERKETL